MSLGAPAPHTEEPPVRSLVYLVATSLDGFIAGPDGDTSVLEEDLESAAAALAAYPDTCPAHLREVFGISGPPVRFDTVVMGAATHRPALAAGLTSAYPHLTQYVATHADLPEDPTQHRWEGDLAARVRELKAAPGGDIWLCGGGDLAGQLVEEIDEIHLKVHPVLLGEGVPVVRGAGLRRFTHVSSSTLAGGVVLSVYTARASGA